jgi:hypothetical protein
MSTETSIKAGFNAEVTYTLDYAYFRILESQNEI